MSTKTAATINDLLHASCKAELVGGEIVMMSPTGGLPNHAAGKIYARLLEYVERTGRGAALTDNAAFVLNLPHRNSFSPDAAYYDGALTMKFVQGPPTFAVEVRSEGDCGPNSEREIADKRADYFAAGTLVVWDVDLLGDDVIRACRSSAPTEPTAYRRGEVAEAEPAVPGWSMAVDELFLPTGGR